MCLNSASPFAGRFIDYALCNMVRVFWIAHCVIGVHCGTGRSCHCELISAHMWTAYGLPIPNTRNGICEFPAVVSCTSADGLFPRKNILGGCICYGESSHDGHIWAIFLWGDYHHQVIFCPIQHSYETRHWTYRVIIHMVVYFSALCFPIDMESWNKEISPGFLVLFMSLLQRCLC
jgi:hypothetical protein